MSNDLLRAKTALEQKDYSKALNICTEIIQKKEDTPECYAIAAHAFLFVIDDPRSEKNQNTFGNTVTNAALGITSAEDACKLEYDLRKAINEWRSSYIRAKLEAVRAKPELKEGGTLDQYNNSIVPFFYYIFILSGCLFGDMAAPYVKEVIGKTDKDAVEALRHQYEEQLKGEDPLPDDVLYDLQVEAAMDIFERTSHFFEENNDSARDFALEVGGITRMNLMVANLLIGQSVPQEGKETESDIPKSEIINRLKMQASIQEYKLNAIMRPDGKPMSLDVGEDVRRPAIGELERLYKRIQKLDQTFVIPSLPSIMGVVPPKGGCYVATAVYGSYDCPQVWTLRRFRDDALAETWYGRAFIHTYYAISPTLVKWFGKSTWFRQMWKPTLDRMVLRLNREGVSDTPYSDRNWK